MPARIIAVVQAGQANYNKKCLAEEGQRVIRNLAQHFLDSRTFSGLVTRVVHCANSPACVITAQMIARTLGLKAEPNILLNPDDRAMGVIIAKKLLEDVLGIECDGGIIIGRGDLPQGIVSGLIETKGKKPIYERFAPGVAFQIYRSTGEHHKIVTHTEKV